MNAERAEGIMVQNYILTIYINVAVINVTNAVIVNIKL